ncbi:hypothetical protein GCM10022220_71990 [Actinocatenispora rupis]|uniref:Uncharacterized protein n=1 Tax=Actinocatenispora rupis TaxID=519421 RepID=A0A8J3NGS4_9ACTN|nr:hypothetical protein Aru02nite_71840 [Actinocatenispora rupis]
MRATVPTGRGLGLQSRRLADGTGLWGHDGDIVGYQAASWSTVDTTRQVRVAGTGDLDTLVTDFRTTAARGVLRLPAAVGRRTQRDTGTHRR